MKYLGSFYHVTSEVKQIINRIASLESRGTIVSGQVTVAFESPTAKTYWVNLRADIAFTIKRVSAKTVAGTCSLQLVTDTGNLGSSVSCSTTQVSNTVSLSVPAGAFLKVTLSSVVGVDDLCLTLDYESPI